MPNHTSKIMIPQLSSSDRELLTGSAIPRLLREIPKPPKQLWIEGALPPPDIYKYLCVIGPRRHSSYGKKACEHLIAGLAGYNICIVSGLALGIDSVAHEAALLAGLPTIAFPGSGLDRSVLYPTEHHELAKRIIEKQTDGTYKGALISEYDPLLRSAPWTFPQRNRLMAGISHATLMIEAEENSGTLITAMYTSDFNRDLMVLPGDIFSPLTYGTHKFMRLGATPVRSSEDILEVLGIEPKSNLTKESPYDTAPDILNTSDTLNALEQSIADILHAEPLSYDDILNKVQLKQNISVPELSATLSKLEQDKVIENVDAVFRYCSKK